MNHMRQSLIGRCLNFFAMLAFLVLQVPGAAFADTTAGESEARQAIAVAPLATDDAAGKATKEPAAAESVAEQSEPGIAASLGKSFRSFMDKLTGKSAQSSESGASGQSGQSSQTGTKVTHDALKFFVPEKRIRLDAAVVDPKGVTMVRAYFKSKTQADFVFVPMEAQQTAKDSYVANLPAMAKSNTEIQYLFLVVNGANEVLKTEPFMVKAKDSTDVPSWQMVNGDESVKLFTEVPDAPAVAASFSDSVSLNVVESGARFGLVAQLYGASGSATASGAAAGATNAGTTAVATAGMSTVTIAAAAAGLVGVAAAGGGGGSAAPAAAGTPIAPVAPGAPAPAICSTQFGSGSGSNTQTLDFGNLALPIKFQISMAPYSMPDRFRITHDGQEIYNSGFIASSDWPTGLNGWGIINTGATNLVSQQLSISVGSKQITVLVEQPLPGGTVGSGSSVWDYSIICN